MPQPVMWRRWCWTALWRPKRASRTNTEKRYPFHLRELECKSRKSRNTWSNRQVWLWSTRWSRAKANRVLPRDQTGHSKHPLPTTQETTLHMDITQMINTEIRMCIFFAAEDGEALSAKTRLGADCGWDHELLIIKFRLILKKIGKTTRPFSMT